MRKLVRLSVAIGGFLLVASVILTGIVLMASLNLIDVSFLADQVTMSLLTLMFLIVGIMDFIAGITLLIKR
jgi:hypothetical protein